MVRALRRVRSVTGGASCDGSSGAHPRRRSVRGGLRSAVRARARPLAAIELLAVPLGLVPLAFASAVVRYRLMDVEVIIKRGVVYATAIAPSRPSTPSC